MPNLLTAAIDLRDGVAQYLARLQRRGCSARTLVAYGSDLRQYVQHVESRRDSTLVALQSQRQASGWLDALSAANVAQRSQARKLTVLRGFFKFAFAEGWIGHDPTAGERVKYRARRVIAPEMAQLHAIVDAIPRASQIDMRDRAMLRLALDAAVRVSECASLDVPGLGSQATVDLKRELVHVVGKGGDTRTIAINDTTARMIEEWLRVRPFVALEGEAALFVSQRGRRLSRQALHVMCKARAKAAGIDADFSWHMFRHRRIADVCETCGVKVAQEHAGHLHASTTQDVYGRHANGVSRALIRQHADVDASRRARA